MLSQIGIASTATMALRTGVGFAAAPSTVKTAVNFHIPRGACDCHVHSFDPARLPYLPQRPFTPPPATVDDLRELLHQLHLDRVDAAPLAQALVNANPDRILWGTDWPHLSPAYGRGKPLTEISPPLPIDDGLVLNQLARWVPDPAIRKKILVDNPARLYGFESLPG
jgi:predicted TIM-barrel fold metal-dependent hydrolase